MRDGRALAAAIGEALRLSGLRQKELADRLGKTPSAVNQWVQSGRISRANLAAVIAFFEGVVGPEHWGTYRGLAPQLAEGLTERERDLLEAFKALPSSRQQSVIEHCKEARRAKWFPEPVGV